MDQYTESVIQYIGNQQKCKEIFDKLKYLVIQLKHETLKRLNEVTLVHYEKNYEKIQKIKEEFQ